MFPRLIGAELNRLRRRRAVLALVGFALLVPATIAAMRIHGTAPRDAEARSEVLAVHAVDIDRCMADPLIYGLRGAPSRADCEEAVVQMRDPRRVLDLARERYGDG